MSDRPESTRQTVVGLRSDVEPRAGEPVPELVDTLERLLEKARSGEVQGLVACALYRDLSYGAYTSGVGCGSAHMVGGLTKLLHKVVAE